MSFKWLISLPPPPPRKLSLAALTIASIPSFVMSPLQRDTFPFKTSSALNNFSSNSGPFNKLKVGTSLNIHRYSAKYTHAYKYLIRYKTMLLKIYLIRICTLFLTRRLRSLIKQMWDTDIQHQMDPRPDTRRISSSL